MHVTVLGKASNTREAGAVILYGCQNSPENSNFYLPAVLKAYNLKLIAGRLKVHLNTQLILIDLPSGAVIH